MQCIGRKCINIGTILVSLIFISCSSMLSDLKFSSQNSSNSATGLTSSAEQSQQIFSTLSFDISDSPNDAQWNEENLDTENGEISSSYVYAVTALYGTSTTDFIPTSSCMTFDSERYEFMGWGGVKSDDYSVYYSSTYLSEIPSTFPSEDKTFYAIWFDTSLLSDGTMTIINPASTDIALTVTVSGTTITANCTHESSDLTEVSWYLDGVLQSDGDATETTISDVATGTHTLYVVASDGYETYTIRAKVTISE